jgi:hypothetical protein
MEYNASALNEMFLQKINTPDGIEKAAQEGAAFIRQKLREVSFARKVIQPQFVTRPELQRSINHEGLVKIVDIEPDSKAMVVTFRGNPDGQYIEGPRYEIPFFMISSPDFQKTESELRAYGYPITEIMERNSVLDIHKVEDEQFLKHVNAAIDIEVGLGNTYKSITGSYDTDGTIKRKDLKDLFDALDGDKLRCEYILMDSTMFNRLLLYTASDLGDTFQSDVTLNGFTYSAFLGRKLIVSNKKDLLDNTIYAFTTQDFFGQFLILEDTKFWIEKKKNIVTFAAYEEIGMGIGNTRACAKLTLS